MFNYSPIILFVYKRLETLSKTVESLQANKLASESDLYIFSDAEKYQSDKVKVQEVRNYIKKITGFRKVIIFESKVNKGLANSIIEGVTKVLIKHDSVIVIEDDLVSSPNFLRFMNDTLSFYKTEQKIFSITGFSIPILTKSEYDIYFTKRSSSWGWATWKDRWDVIDWSISDYEQFNKDLKQKKIFNKMGSDMATMLDKQMKGQINSWAIRWCYHQFKHNLFSVHPFISKIENIGFNSAEASNTQERINRYKTKLDKGKKLHFILSKEYSLDQKIVKQFRKPYSIYSRIKYKILNY